jgi:hypothetical protein
MYYTPTSQVVGKWIILTLIGIGLLLGLVLIGSDFARPLNSLREFLDAQVERHLAIQQGEIDLRQHETLQEANTEAEIAQKQEEIRHQKQLHEEEAQHQELIHEQELQQSEAETRYLQQLHDQKLQQAQEQAALGLELTQVAGYSGIAVAGLVFSALGIGLSVRVARRRQVKVARDVWTQRRKSQAIEAARQREREQHRQVFREQKLHQTVTELQNRLEELEASVSSDRHKDSDEILLEPLFLASGHDETGQLCTQMPSDAKSATAN